MMIEIIPFQNELWKECTEIWNVVVKDGEAFPQTEFLDQKTGCEFFNSQSYTGVAVDQESREIVGLYILHPNNIGRCGHICNASYAVKKDNRGKHIGELLVGHCIKKGKELGFRILQFNAVVAANRPALALYKKMGFTQLGTIPKGFLLKSGKYEDIIPHYMEL